LRRNGLSRTATALAALLVTCLLHNFVAQRGTGELGMSISEARDRFVVARQVMGALMLRDMRTRFGRSHLGYLLTIMWPFLHIVLIVSIYTVLGRTAPIGTSTVTFLALGIMPYVLFVYPNMQISRSIVMSRPLLSFPRVKIMDVILARTILEVLGACVVCAIVALALLALGYEFEPHDFAMLLGGFGLAVYLGVSVGILSALVAGVWPGSLYLTSLVNISLWASSGTFFLPDMMPEVIRNVLWFNPLLHSVELVRTGYYADFRSGMLSVPYIFWFATTVLFLGLVIESVFRRSILTR
jgi:capsular polysaccharide transport system permease protein